MADLIGNYGYGIALGGKPKDYEGLYAQGIRQRQLNEAKKQKDDDAAYDKFSNKIKIDGVHRLYQDESEKDFSGTLDKAFQVWNDPKRKYDRKNSMAKIAGEFVERQKGRQAASKKLDEFEKQYQEAAATGRTTPLQDKLFTKVKNGSWDDINDLTSENDEVGSVHFDPSTKGLAVSFRPKIDTNSAEEKILKDPSLQTAQQEMIKGITMKGGKQRYTMSYIPRTEQEAQEISGSTGIPGVSSLESINSKLMSTEGYAHAKAYDQMHTMASASDIAKLPLDLRKEGMNQLNYGSYRDFNKPFKELNPSQKANVVAKNNYQDLMKVSGAKIKEKDDNPNAAKESHIEGNTWSVGDYDIAYNVSPVNGTKTVIPTMNKEKKMVEKQWVDSDGQPFTGVISDVTQRQGELPVVHVTKTLTPDDGISRIDKKTGVNLKDGQATRQVKDANGNVKNEKIKPSEIYIRKNPTQKEEVLVEVPYTNVRNKQSARLGGVAFEDVVKKFEGKASGNMKSPSTKGSSKKAEVKTEAPAKQDNSDDDFDQYKRK